MIPHKMDGARFKIIGLFASVFLMGILLPAKGYGAGEEDFRAVFNADYYYDQNPDLQAVIGKDSESLFRHFIHTGIREGRSGNEQFNLKAYVYYNPDLLDAYKTDLAAYCRHYETLGKAEGRLSLFSSQERSVIGFYHTDYDKTLPRASNIHLAASRINGLVLQPGERFSFSQAVLSRTPENGYVMAPAIGGMEYGGGICQVSSTLYAAMCHALLPATERYPHSSRISYMPEGLDATISEGHKDLTFINPYDKPLTIVAAPDETGLTVSLLLGASDSPSAPLPEENGDPEDFRPAHTSDWAEPGTESQDISSRQEPDPAHVSDQAGPGTAHVSDQAGPGTANASMQAGPGTANVSIQAGPDPADPTTQAES